MRNRTPFTLEDLKKSPVVTINQHLFVKTDVKKKRSKYNNQKVFFNDHYFDSQKECNYYIALRARLIRGEISDLKLQQAFQLNEGGTHSLEYIADFTWQENGLQVVCDVKGFKTVSYKKKRALMLKVHAVTIKEI